jgi:hypothetical protein
MTRDANHRSLAVHEECAWAVRGCARQMKGGQGQGGASTSHHPRRTISTLALFVDRLPSPRLNPYAHGSHAKHQLERYVVVACDVAQDSALLLMLCLQTCKRECERCDMPQEKKLAHTARRACVCACVCVRAVAWRALLRDDWEFTSRGRHIVVHAVVIAGLVTLVVRRGSF